MKTVIVTGDSRGLGNRVVGKLLNKEEYEVVGISRSESDSIKKLKEKFTNKYTHLEFDLSQPEKVKELYLDDLKTLGPIYGLVNNAAFAYDDIVTNARTSSLEKLFKVNVFSPIMLTKYVIRDMLLHKTEGSIVHVSTVSTATGYKGLSMYAASKGALESFSKGVAREWGERGIRSNCVAPGFMETSMSSGLTEEQKDRIYKRTSLKKPTDIDSVAETVEFLLSEESYSLTGTVVRVDNGTV